MPNSERYHLMVEIKTAPAAGIVAPAPGQSALQPLSPAGKPEPGKPDNDVSKSEQAISESNKLEAEKFDSPLPLRVPAIKPALPASNTPVKKEAIKVAPYPEAKP